MDPLHYNDIANEFDAWKAANPQKRTTLSEFAQLQDMAEGTPKRQAAYNDNFLKHVNAGIDNVFAPVGNLVAPIGSSVDELARMVMPSYTGHAGEEAMRGAPRTAAEFAGYLLAPGTAVPRALSLGAKGLGMADAALKGYSETDSPLAGVISAASLPLTSGLMNVGESTAAKLMTRGLAEQVAAAPVGGALEATANPVADQLAAFIGGNAGGLAANEITRQATGLATGQGLTNPFTTENVVGNIAGLAPFAAKPALDAFHGRFNPRIAAERAKVLAPYEQELRTRDEVSAAAATRDAVTGAEAPNTDPLFSASKDAFGPTVGGEAASAKAAEQAVGTSMADYISRRKISGEPPATNVSMFDYDHPALAHLEPSLPEQAPAIARTFKEAIQPGPESVKNLPDWAREEMIRQGIDPNRPLNDYDLANPSIQEALRLSGRDSKGNKIKAVDIGPRDTTISTGDGVPTAHETAMMDEWRAQIAAEQGRLSQMRPEDASTVDRLTKFISDVNSTLQATWDEQTQRAATAKSDLDRAANLRRTLGITGIEESPESAKTEVTAFNPLALRELQGEGRVPAITPEWLQKNFGLMLDRSLVDTPQDAYLHTVQKVANLMADLGEKAKAQKSLELQNRAELQSSTRRKTEAELDAAHFENVKQLPLELQNWLTQQALKDREVSKFGGKTPQSVWPMRRDLVDQAIKNLDRATGMTKVTVALGKDRQPVTLSLPLEQAVKGVHTVQTPEGPKEVSFIKARALKTSAGERTSVGTQSLDALDENLAKQKGAAPVEQDISDVAAEYIGSATREVKDFGEGPEVTHTPTSEAVEPESRSLNEQDANANPRDVVREALGKIYKGGPETFGSYADIFEGRMPEETKAKIKKLFGKGVEATLTNNKGLQREFAAEWFGRDPATIDPVTMNNALQSFWGGNGRPRYEAFVQRIAKLTGLTPDALKAGMYDSANHVVVAPEDLPDLKTGLLQGLKDHAALQGMGPEAQAHFVATGMKFVDLIKMPENYKFTKLDVMDSLSRERLAQRVSEDLQVAGLHGMAYMTPEGKLVRNPFIGIALDHSARRGSDQPFYNWLTLSTIGHEAIHSIDARLTDYAQSSDPDLRQYAGAYTNMFAEANTLSPQERFSVLRGVAESILPPQYFKGPDGRLNEAIKGYLTHGAVNPKEFIPVYAQMYFSGLVTGGEKLQTAKMLEHQRWESPAVQDFMRGVYRQIGDYSGALQVLATQHDPMRMLRVNDVAKAVNTMQAELPKLVRKDAIVAKAERDVTQVASVLGRGAVTTLADGAPAHSPPDAGQLSFMKIAGIEFGGSAEGRINEALGLAQDHLFGNQKKLNFWSRNLMPFVQAAGRTGEKVAMDAAMTLLDSNRGRTNISNQLLMPTLKKTPYGGLTINKEHPLRELMASKDVKAPERVAFNEVGDLLQELGDAGKLKTNVQEDQTGRLADGFTQLRKLNPELDTRTGAILEKMSPERRGKVLAAVDSALEIYHTGGQVLIKSQQDHMGSRLTRVMQTIDPNIPYDQALESGRLLMQGVDLKQKSIIDQALQGRTPEQAQSLLELAMQLNAPIGELRKMVAERPFFMSEQRQGQYIITSMKDGQRFVDSADNEGHVTKVGQHLKALGHEDLQWFDKYARYGEFAGDLPMQYADRFAQLEQEAYSQSLTKIAQRFGQPVADALLTEFSPIKAVQKDLGAKGVNRLLQERNRVPSALGLDYVRNLDAYVQSLSVSASNRAVRDKISVLSADKAMNNAPDFKPMLEAQLANTLRRGDQTTQQLKTILTSYYLAGNLGSMMVEGAQTFSSLVPVLIQNGSTVRGAYGKLMSAASDAASYRLTPGKLNTLADKGESYLGVAPMPKDVEKAYLYRRWLQESPEAGSHLEDNTISPDQSAILSARNRNGNYEDLPVGTIARNGLYQLAQKGLKMYSAFSQFNNKAAFLAAMDHVHEQGLSGDAAYQSARQIVYSSMFGGGRANSANYIAKLSMSPYMRPIVAIQSTLSSYSLGMTSMLGSLAHDAILGDKTLNPMQRRQAQKAFGVAFATQMGLAGALGMPFAAAGLAAIEKLTGIQANAAVRQGLASLAGDDQELGGLFADVALNGAANQLLGVDVGGRTGLSSVLGTSAYSGFNFKDLLGPAPSVFENMANATLSFSQGEVGQAVTDLVPQSFKHSAQLLDSQRTYGKPQIMDKSNNLIMEPSNMEALMYAVGLQPGKLRNYKAEQKLLKTADDAGAQLHDRDLDGLAQKVLSGDTRSTIDYIQAQRASNPAVDPKALVSSVADRVLAMQQPKDLMAGGNQQSWNDRAAIASTFPQGPRQSELQKLIAKEQILAQMGYPFGSKPAGPEEYTQAAMLDQMVGQGTPRGQAQQKLSYLGRLIRGSAQP